MASSQEFEQAAAGAAGQVASFEEQVTTLRRFQHFLHGNPAAVPLIVLIGLIIFFGLAVGGKFFSAFTLTLILQQVAVVGILAAAQTLVVLTKGIDLSGGVTMVFAFVLMGHGVLSYGLPGPFAVLIGFILAGLCGCSTALVSRIKLPPFIVTLGTWYIIMALCLIYSANETLREADVTAATTWLHFFGISFKIGNAPSRSASCC